MFKNRLNYLLFLLLALLWSGSFIGIKVAVDHLPPVCSAMLRVVISQICLTLFFLMRRKALFVPFATCWRLWIAGIFSQGLPFALLFYGERSVAPGLASILNSTVSIWALLFNVFFFRDRTQLTFNKISGLLLGLFGVVYIFWPMLHNSHSHSTFLGTLAIVAMAISYAMGALLNQHLIAGKMKAPFHASLWQQHWASIIFLCVLSFSIEPWPAFSVLAKPSVILALLYLGLCATAIAWMIYFYLLREWDAVRASSVMYIVPLLTMTWDYLFFHSTPASAEFVGALAVLAGVTLIQWQRQKR